MYNLCKNACALIGLAVIITGIAKAYDRHLRNKYDEKYGVPKSV